MIASSTNTLMPPARKEDGKRADHDRVKNDAGGDGSDDGAPAQPVAGEADVEGPRRQRHEEHERRQQAGIVGALRYDRDEVERVLTKRMEKKASATPGQRRPRAPSRGRTPVRG